MQYEYDFIVIGSGFGGSVSALRLSEKGYKVLVVEKGKWYKSKDFAKNNWNLRKWLWLPVLRFFGILNITLFKHVSILSGVGVGGGSLVYANTLPVPDSTFFKTGSWSKLRDWNSELQPYYQIALKMLGATKNPQMFDGDQALKELSKKIDREAYFDAPNVGVYFGDTEKEIKDPYFGGAGPDRKGCIFCGSCMTGCRENAKNSLDKNYLYLARKLGAKIIAENEVVNIQPLNKTDGSDGYSLTMKRSTRIFGKKTVINTKGIVFSGGVLGTVPLLLKLKEKSLPNLSARVGMNVRINNETIVTVTSAKDEKDYSKGLAIGSILKTDENSHVEVVRYGKGSGFWKLSHVPIVTGNSVIHRILKIIGEYVRHPLQYFKMYWVGDWSKKSSIILFMQSLDNTLGLRRNSSGRITTFLDMGKKPTADIPESTELSKKFAKITEGKTMTFFQQVIFGKASTAHILGGAVMGESIDQGVIDENNRVFGYKNMLVIDGSMISANPGVNPALSITAIAERAMNTVPDKVIKNL